VLSRPSRASAGRTFLEAKDRELALLCVEAYNDWMVEQWCGPSNGRLVPLTLIPLWDAGLAADEVRRNARAGVHAVCFSEIPPFLGLPSVHDPNGYWDPFFRRLRGDRDRRQHAHRLLVQDALDSGDAPPAWGRRSTHTNATFSLVDYLFSGVFVRFRRCASPTRRARSAGSPTSWSGPTRCGRRTGLGRRGGQDSRPAVVVLPRPRLGCFFDDAHGVRCIEEIGVDNVTYESDYPHSDSTWPHTAKLAEQPDGLAHRGGSATRCCAATQK